MAEQTEGLKQFTEVLETIADNKFIIGDRLVEVGVSGPRLESTLSAIAMAQGELGHARLLYNWVLDLQNHKGKKPEIEKQTGKAFPFTEKVDNWLSLIAALETVNICVDVVLKAILKANKDEAVSRIQKLANEQKEHIIYAEGWSKQLLEDAEPVRKKFEEYLNEFLPQAENWLNSLREKTALVDEGYLLPDTDLAAEFNSRIKKTAVVN